MAAQTGGLQPVAELAAEERRVPLLAEHRDHPTPGDGGADDALDQGLGEGPSEGVQLGPFPLVHARRIVLAHLLAPAEQPHPLRGLLGRQRRVPDEDEGGRVAGGGEGSGQLAGADSEATREAVAIRPLEGDHDHLESRGIEHVGHNCFNR